MLLLETSIQRLVKVELPSTRINDLVSGLPQLGRTLALGIGTQLLDQVQELLFAQAASHAAEIVCTRCGVVHVGGRGRSFTAGHGRAG